MNQLIYIAAEEATAQKRLQMAQVTAAVLVAQGWWGTVWMARLSSQSRVFLNLGGYRTLPVNPYLSIHDQISQLVDRAPVEFSDYI